MSTDIAHKKIDRHYEVVATYAYPASQYVEIRLSGSV
ncbi:hypothetical protein FVEN_g13028 [Fusarium venenatum]|nr:hypothetical protein FVEN_g13028 [Fusarium venenatum]